MKLNYFVSELEPFVGRDSVTIQRLARGWKVRGLNPGGREILRTHPHRPWGIPRLWVTGLFPRGKAAGGGGMELTTHPDLAPRL
jgi:hypothetical protein